MKHRVPFARSCPRCGGYCEIITDRTAYAIMDVRHANVHDIVACTVCNCVGEIKLWLWRPYLSWPSEDNACSECQLRMAIQAMPAPWHHSLEDDDET